MLAIIIAIQTRRDTAQARVLRLNDVTFDSSHVGAWEYSIVYFMVVTNTAIDWSRGGD